MKNQIPKIIHQLWSDKERPLPEHFLKMADTWKYDYPDWQYIYWNDHRMSSFILEHFPEYLDIYNRFPYNIQRWDAIRYLILYEMGGMYVDFDFESLKPIDGLLSDKQCCFPQEPVSHCGIFRRGFIINNSLMACVPKHVYVKKIIDKVFSEENLRLSFTARNKDVVFDTTGQWVLVNAYESLSEEERKDVYLISPLYINPFDLPLANIAKKGCWDKRLEDSIKDAYAIHYYFGSWND